MGKILKYGCGGVIVLFTITFAGFCATMHFMGDDLKKIADSARVADSVDRASEAIAAQKSTTTEVDYDWLLTEAQYAVKQQLHDPGSADFEYIDESNILRYGDDDARIKEFHSLGPVYLVWGKVRAKNAFGAKVLSTYAVDIQFTKEGKYIVRGIEIE